MSTGGRAGIVLFSAYGLLLSGCFDPGATRGGETATETEADTATQSGETSGGTSSSGTVADESSSSSTHGEPALCRLDEGKLDNCVLE